MQKGKTYKYIGPGLGYKGFRDDKTYPYINDEGKIKYGGNGTGTENYHYFEECETEGKETKELSAEEKYTKMSELSGFQIGDKVKICRRFKRDEMGCPAEFARGMYKSVGEEGVITAKSRKGNFEINREWFWPFFVLEKLEEPPVEVKLNDDYTAVVAGDRETVKVGCQTFSREAVLELAEKLKK